ncbi:MAG: dockerin type I domain-containing protein [Clostridiales bacterium]|nr:dockerin type I domain-containing protein [Clostridiales bacterium]
MKTITKTTSLITAAAIVISLILMNMASPVALAADGTHNMPLYEKEAKNGVGLCPYNKPYRDERQMLDFMGKRDIEKLERFDEPTHKDETPLVKGTFESRVLPTDGGYAAIEMSATDATDITSDFKDPVFLEAVREILGKSEGEPILNTDVSGITRLWVTFSYIQDLAGLEHFISLEELYCYGNQLTVLPALPLGLEFLDCDGNQLMALPTLPENLFGLDCSNNPLQMLPTLPLGLTYLRCVDNQLTTLDISALSALENLQCSKNRLTELALNSTAPYWCINVSYNFMESEAAVTGKSIIWDGDYFIFYPQYTDAIDITADFTDPNFLATVREFLGKGANEPIFDIEASWLTWLDVSYWGISSLAGLEHFTSLRGLSCYYNQITELPTLPPDLEYLDCEGNRLTTLPALPKNLWMLDCSNNLIDELPSSLPPSLEWLYCEGNLLTGLNLSGLSYMYSLWCFNNYMESPDSVMGWRELGLEINNTFRFYPQYTDAIDITADFTDPNFRAAVREFLGKGANEPIFDIDVSWLTWLSVSNRGITSLAGLEHFTSLTELYCTSNQLKELPMLPSGLVVLLCYYNQLDELPALPLGLEYLDCDGNLLTELPALPENLYGLDCSNNSLQVLPTLPLGVTYLRCVNNHLTELPTLPSGLMRLLCDDNMLTRIDLTGLSSLSELWCFNNHMASPDSVIGWRELGLEINSPENPWSGTFMFYPQAEAFAGSAIVGVRVPDVSYINKDVEYTISLTNAVNVLDVELAFEVDGSMLVGKGFTGLNGFNAMSEIIWTYLGDDIWKGGITLGYPSGNDSEGFSSTGSVDIASIDFVPKAEGEAALVLTSVRVVGKNGTEVIDLEAVAEPSIATTVIELVYSKYDLNRDGVIDALDLGVMLLYCGFDKDDPRWDTYVKVNDTKGVGVTAMTCDVNRDGVIDMLDLLDLFIHYGVPRDPDPAEPDAPYLDTIYGVVNSSTVAAANGNSYSNLTGLFVWESMTSISTTTGYGTFDYDLTDWERP